MNQTVVILSQPWNNVTKTITENYIHQNMCHTTYEQIHDMEDLGIIQGILKRTQNLILTCPVLMGSKATCIIFHNKVIT